MHRILLFTCGILLMNYYRPLAQKPLVFHADTSLRFSAPGSLPALRVLDARTQPALVGAVGPTVFTKGEPITLQEPLESAFISWIRCWSGNGKNPGKTSEGAAALFVVHDFFIQEAAYGEQIRTFHLDADLFAHTGPDADGYRYVTRIDSFWEFAMPPIRARPGSLEQQVSKTLIQCLQTTCRLPPATDAPALAATDPALLLRQQTNAYPVFDTNATTPAGLYASATDFLHLRPTDTNLIYIRYKPMDGQVMHLFYHRKENGKRGRPVSPDDYFVLCNGDSWFVGKGRSWTPLIRKNGEFYARHYLKGLDVLQTTAYLSSGALGYLLMKAAANAYDRDLHWVLYETRFDPGREAFIPYRRLGIP